MKYLYIAAGGALGALLRYGAANFTYRFTNGVFPWGTLVINLSGCLVIGYLWGISEKYVLWQHFKPFVFIGILGAYTTFSTFGLETFSLFRDGEMKLAMINILASNMIGLVLVFAGFAFAGSVLKR